MTELEFRETLGRAIAEDDRDICECCKCGASDLTVEGIDILLDIVMAQAELLFTMVADYERALREGDRLALDYWKHELNKGGVR